MVSDRSHLDEDCRRVMAAAAALDLREIDFFRLAFRRWSGRDPTKRELEDAFAAYMFGHRVPYWARHLSRDVLRLDQQGALHPNSFGAARYRPRSAPHPRGKLVVVLTAVAWLVLFTMMLDTTYHPGTSEPMACRGISAFTREWVHFIAGREPPLCPDPYGAGSRGRPTP